MVMDDDAKRKIVADARATLNRLNAEPPSKPRDSVAPDVLKGLATQQTKAGAETT
jgi:hypothetical protein